MSNQERRTPETDLQTRSTSGNTSIVRTNTSDENWTKTPSMYSSSSSVRKRKRELEIKATRRRYEVKSRILKERERLELAADLEDAEDDDVDSIPRSSNSRQNTGTIVDEWIRSTERDKACSESTLNRSKYGKMGTNYYEDDNHEITRSREEPSNSLIRRMAAGKSLPAFDGDILEWPSYKRIFIESTKKIGFSEGENLIRLQESLKGVAKQTVASLMVTAADTSEIMKVLQLRFGNPTVVASRITTELKTLPNTYGVGIDFITFATTVRNVVAALEATNHVGYLHSPELVREITQKMSAGMIHDYNKYLHTNGSPDEPALVTLSKFLFFEAEIACQAGTLEPTPSTTQPKKDKPEATKNRENNRKFGNHRDTSRTKFTGVEKVYATTIEGGDGPSDAKKQKRNTYCGYCESDTHDIGDCNKYHKLTLHERWDWARQNRKCFRCLRTGNHRQNRCREKGCEIDGCQGTHHTLLHRQRTQATDGTRQEYAADVKETTEPETSDS